jgi:hypothetical protein
MVGMPLTHATSVAITARPITKLITVAIAVLLLMGGILAMSHVDGVAGTPVPAVSNASPSSTEATASLTAPSDDVVAMTVGVCIFGVVCCLLGFAWLHRVFALFGRRRLIGSTRRVRLAITPRRAHVPRSTLALLCIARI